MSKWRWPTWAMIGSTALLIALFTVITSAQGDSFGRNEYGAAGEAAGRAVAPWFWTWALGMIVLGVAWRNTKPQATCPRCAGRVDFKWPQCRRCGYYPGAPLPPQFAAPTMAVCPRCSQLVDPRAPSCPNCGYVPGQPVGPTGTP